MSTDPKEIPEVGEFMAAAKELREFKEVNAEFFEAYEKYLEKYNNSLERADKAVRAKQVSCGPFVLTGRPSVRINVDKLVEAIGVDDFKAIGGQIETKPSYTIDKNKVEVAISQKLIPQEAVSSFRTVVCSYSKPEKINTP